MSRRFARVFLASLFAALLLMMPMGRQGAAIIGKLL
jgi:hypothetical protein